MLSPAALNLLHQLRHHGTLTAAADALHMSRSAASHQLATMQRRLGVVLTEKVGRGLRLTEAGTELAIRAEAILAEYEQAEAVVERSRNTVSGVLRLAAVQTIAVNLVPAVLDRLRRRHPDLRVEFASLATVPALTAVPAGTVDVAVVPSYEPAPVPWPAGVRVSRLFRDPLRLLLPRGHRLAEMPGPVSLSDVESDSWVAGEPDGHFGQLVPALCAEAGFTPDIVHRSDDAAVVAALVAAGLGVAVIPASGHLAMWETVVAKPIASPHAGREIVAVTRTGSRSRPTVRAVLRELAAADPAVR